MSNYEKAKRETAALFLQYDQAEMIRKLSLKHTPDFLYITFLRRHYRIGRCTGTVEYAGTHANEWIEAGYNEVMTIYDVLCYSKADCRQAGQFVNMRSLSAIQGTSAPVGGSLFGPVEQLFDNRDDALSRACILLGGTPAGKGDVAYSLPLFEFLPVVFQFWNSDADFPASLELLWDANILNFMHYETVWFAASHLVERLKENL